MKIEIELAMLQNDFDHELGISGRNFITDAISRALPDLHLDSTVHMLALYDYDNKRIGHMTYLSDDYEGTEDDTLTD